MVKVNDLFELQLDGYVCKKRIKTKVGNVPCEKHYFDEDHSSEYEIVYNDGRHKLFKNGMIQMEWVEEDGKKVGLYTVFEGGLAKYSGKWESLAGSGEIARMVNLKNGKFLELIDRKTMVVVYRGGYTKSWLRHNHGLEYNRNSGNLESECMWINGKKKTCIREFVKNNMTEYSSSSSNLTLADSSVLWRLHVCRVDRRDIEAWNWLYAVD